MAEFQKFKLVCLTCGSDDVVIEYEMGRISDICCSNCGATE